MRILLSKKKIQRQCTLTNADLYQWGVTQHAGMVKRFLWVSAVNLTVGKHGPHLQVAGGQPDDGGLIQLRGDGRGQRQELGKLVKLSIFFLSSRFCRILGLFLHLWHVATPLRIIKAHLKLQGCPAALRWNGVTTRSAYGNGADFSSSAPHHTQEHVWSVLQSSLSEILNTAL